MANPKDAVRVFVQGGNTAVLEAGSVDGGEDSEADAVKAHEALISRQPDVAVAGLENGGGRVGDPAVLDLPDIVRVGRGAGRRQRLRFCAWGGMAEESQRKRRQGAKRKAQKRPAGSGSSAKKRKKRSKRFV